MLPDRFVRAITHDTTDRGQTGQMDLLAIIIAIVAAGTAAFVGILVMSQVIDSTALTSGDPLYNASQSLQTSINDVWSLIGVLFIVVILAGMITYLYALRR